MKFLKHLTAPINGTVNLVRTCGQYPQGAALVVALVSIVCMTTMTMGFLMLLKHLS